MALEFCVIAARKSASPRRLEPIPIELKTLSTSCAGLTRASINKFIFNFKEMDRRVKPGDDH